MSVAMWGKIIEGAGVHMENVGTYMRGISEGQAAKFEAKQMRANAKAIEAQGQRTAKEKRWEGDMTKSADLARQAASGGGVDTSRQAKIQNMTDYNALAAIYESRTQADVMRDMAKMREREGREARRAAEMATVTNFMEYAGGSMGSMGG